MRPTRPLVVQVDPAAIPLTCDEALPSSSGCDAILKDFFHEARAVLHESADAVPRPRVQRHEREAALRRRVSSPYKRPAKPPPSTLPPLPRTRGVCAAGSVVPSHGREPRRRHGAASGLASGRAEPFDGLKSPGLSGPLGALRLSPRLSPRQSARRGLLAPLAAGERATRDTTGPARPGLAAHVARAKARRRGSSERWAFAAAAAREAQARSAERTASSSAVAAADAARRERIVDELREYDNEAARPLSPTSALCAEAEEACERHEAKELRAQIRIALQSSEEEERNDPLVWLRSAGRPLSLGPASFAPFVSKLALAGTAARHDDAWVAARIYAALSASRAARGGQTSPSARGAHGGASAAPAARLGLDTITRGMLPAFSRVRSIRLRWIFSTFYDPARRGALRAIDIFALLDEARGGMPDGCRLEEDLLMLVKFAAARRDAGETPVLITAADYVGGLGGLRSRLLEPDPLGLRRRRRGSEQGLRAKARSIMLARRWSVTSQVSQSVQSDGASCS